MKIRRKKSQGYTFLEVLVSLVLLSIVTLVISIALKLAIDSWSRGAEEGEDTQLRMAIPAIMEKQLRSLVKINPFDPPGKNQLLPLCGRPNAVSFFTTYAPQASPWQGLLRVAYVFDKEEKSLYLYEQVITEKEDLRAALDPLSDGWDGSLAPVSKVSGITEYRLFYFDQKMQDLEDAGTRTETWKTGSKSLPAILGVKLQVGTGPQAKKSSWYFRIKGMVDS